MRTQREEIVPRGLRTIKQPDIDDSIKESILSKRTLSFIIDLNEYVTSLYYQTCYSLRSPSQTHPDTTCIHSTVVLKKNEKRETNKKIRN